MYNLSLASCVSLALLISLAFAVLLSYFSFLSRLQKKKDIKNTSFVWVVCVHCNVTKREFMAHATKYDRKIAVKCMALKSPKRDESFASDMCFPSALLFFFIIFSRQLLPNQMPQKQTNNENVRKVSHLWDTIIGQDCCCCCCCCFSSHFIIFDSIFFLVAPKELDMCIYIGIFGGSWRKITESVRWTGRSDLNKKHIFYVETRLLFSE